MVKKSVDEIIGHTPLMEICNIEKEKSLYATVLVKLEFLNPTGSVKDRAAKSIIDDAEAKGLLKPHSVIVEATSGNTGIGIASVAASRGYKTIIIMPGNMSKERIALMRAYGAEVVLSDPAKGMAGSLEKLNEIKSKYPDCFEAGQFVNKSNSKAHYDTTGPEIYEDTCGNIDFFVAGVGTGGTITGTGMYLKEKNPNVKLVAVEPSKSPLLSKGISGSHGLQGIGANFIPDILDMGIIDKVICVSDEDAYESARLLGKKEGVMCGITSGAALCAAIELAKQKENEGKTVVALLPDSGDRYLSTALFDK